MNVNGVVENINNPDKFGNCSINVNGQWYNSKPEYVKVMPKEGDTVDFIAKGKYFNNLKVVSAGGGVSGQAKASGTAGGGQQTQGFLAVELERNRAIIRQNALTSAVNAYAGSLIDVSEEQGQMDECIDDIIYIARKFEAYTSGDADIDEVKESLKNMNA
jgi:hypothetical protein